MNKERDTSVLKVSMNFRVHDSIFESVYVDQDPKSISQLLYTAADMAATNPNFKLGHVMDIEASEKNFQTIQQKWSDRKTKLISVFLAGFIAGFAVVSVLGALYYG